MRPTDTQFKGFSEEWNSNPVFSAQNLQFSLHLNGGRIIMWMFDEEKPESEVKDWECLYNGKGQPLTNGQS